MRKILYIAVVCISLLSCSEEKMPSGMAFGTPSSSSSVETPSITASETSLSFSADGGSTTVTITANFAWESISTPDWITISPTSGSNGSTSLTVKADRYTGTTTRTGTIIIGMTSSTTVSITVRQQVSSENNVYAVQLATGGATITQMTGHSLLLKNDCSLWAWGANSSGQLGDGTFTDKYVPTKVLENVNQVDAGLAHSIAILNDGTLWAWGYNQDGQLGIGTSRNAQKQPVKVLDNVKQAAAGYLHSLAVKEDGTLWAWGSNVDGELGNGTTTPRDTANPNPIYIMDDVIQVAAGFYHSLALKKDGSVWSWGNNSEGQLGDGTLENKSRPVKVMDDVKSVIAGERNSFALKRDNSLWAWGYNNNGNFGNGTYAYSNPTPIKIAEKVVLVAPGAVHTLIVKDDASLWGSGPKSQLGVGADDGYEYSFVKLMSNVELVTTSRFGCHSLVAKSDGTLWGWSYNKYGQLGNGATAEIVLLPIQCFSVSSLK